MWVLDRDSFQNTLKSLNRMNYEENSAFISQIPVFDVLTDDQKERITTALISHNFQNGTTIIKEGDPGDLLYIVKEGTVKIYIGRTGTVRNLDKGEFFGEQALLYNCPRTATVVAEGETTCLSPSRADLK